METSKDQHDLQAVLAPMQSNKVFFFFFIFANQFTLINDPFIKIEVAILECRFTSWN